ncbi:MAG: glutaminase domain-containing protein [Bacteroidota bacterium]
MNNKFGLFSTATRSILSLMILSSLMLMSCQPLAGPKKNEALTAIRAPAYPLVTIDPYTSVWSFTDNLFDSPVRHWTGKTHALIGALRVDGKVYRFLGKEEIFWKALIPMANQEAWEGKYSFTEPKGNWTEVDYDTSLWETGKGAFGTRGMPALGTRWNTQDIWVRREFNLPPAADRDIYLIYSHDDIFELYLNGKQLVKTDYEWHNDVVLKIDRNLLYADGKNVIAAHCHNRTGGGYVDFGLFQENENGEILSLTAEQMGVYMSATQTMYDFTCGPVDLKVGFVSPLLPDDLDLLSRPVNYIHYEVVSNDGNPHHVEIYFEATPQWSVDVINQEVVVSSGTTGKVNYLRAGTTEQPILQKRGDDRRIDWGYFYLAPGNPKTSRLSVSNYYNNKLSFAENGTLGDGEGQMITKMTEVMPAMSLVSQVGKVSGTAKTGFVMIAYDDIESIQYFGDNLKAWWTKNGTYTIDQALEDAAADYVSIIDRCTDFDKKMWDEALQKGGKNYADLCVLAFRQSIAAHKLVKDLNGNTLFLSKENFSNGSIGTVDVTYPSAPLYLKYNPELLKGMMNPIFYYTESGKWTKPFAAHDVGTYPHANGQTYGGDMPVEESGNMLILATAIAHMEGNADYAGKHWESLTTWANYLLEHGLDPDNQLCTDDFAGHFAHNVNLSVKAIMGIAGYGKLAEMLGKKDIAEKYTQEAKSMAMQWMEMANDGDHYKLTFDQPGTWSQKYNLVWDKLLGLGIFPAEVAETEIAYYLTMQNPYGLPLDNRRTYTKSDWIVWTATLANDMATFQKFIDPLHRFVSETPDRVPMSDWYETTNAKKVGFQARSVVGGYFIKMLEK